jgi:hypothetical protein
MVEIREPYRELFREERIIDTSMFKKRGNFKTFKGYLIQKIKDARNDEHKDLVFILMELYNKYKEFEQSENIQLNSWKGKSSFEVIEKPDSYIIIKYQKPDQDSKPEIKLREITKFEANKVLSIIHELNIGQKISTREIGERLYNRKWDDIFSDRFAHTQLNYILRLLDYKKIIKYRGRFSKLL